MDESQHQAERGYEVTETAIGGLQDTTAAESRERAAAIKRGEDRARRRAEGDPEARDPYSGLAHAEVASKAFAALAENVRDYAIFLMDPHGVITFWGEGARLIKWWSVDQAEGAHLRMLYPDGGSEDGTAEEHLIEAAERGEYTGEGHRVRGNGSTFWAGLTLTALWGDDGTLLGFAKVTRDLTAQRAAEAALKAAHDSAEEARRHAEEASRAKSLFLATMSHEIRTPMNSIMAYTDLLEMELAGPITDQQRSQLHRIRTGSMHLLGIVEDVLDYSRIEAGRTAVRRTVGRVGPPVEAAVALTYPQAQSQGVELTDAVSGFAGGEMYLGDEERVRQILINLLGNAIKFTPRGGRVTMSAGTAASPPADVYLPGDGPWVYIRVEDTGPGIPPARLTAIFEPFEQADMNLTRQHGGTGLGLAISRGLARLMGGDLTVRSQEGAGSTFFLWLPGAPEKAIAAPRTPGPVPYLGSAGKLVDTRDSILREMERILHAYVARLRSDPAIPTAHAFAEPELEDHLASFLSDLAQTLSGMDLAKADESQSLRDGTAIQRTIAERHGRQRYRIGWSEKELLREFEILKEELAAAVRRRVRKPRDEEVEEAIRTVEEFVDRAERVSVESYRMAARE